MESNVFHDSRPAGLITDEDIADSRYGQDQAETNLVKLVDGKLVPTANVGDEASSGDGLLNRFTNDEERGVNSPNERTYDVVNIENGNDQPTVTDDMIPSTPDPYNPVPTGPETPTPPGPVPAGPEIPDLPGENRPEQPEITDPTQPGRSHEINNSQDTLTSGLVGTMPGVDVPNQQNPAPNEELPEFLGTSSANSVNSDASPKDDEGMDEHPDTGTSARPYDVNAKDTHSYQSSERPQESAQMMSQPREAMDESAIKKQPMADQQHESPSDMKSTDQLDLKYNDPEAARQDVI